MRDLPPGVSPQEAAALVYGAERAARDLIVSIRTEDMRHTEVHSAVPTFKPPVPLEHRGLSFVDVERAASAAGFELTETPAGYRLAGVHGVITRPNLGELVEFIRRPRDIPNGEYR
jgi:hypothetical protein